MKRMSTRFMALLLCMILTAVAAPAFAAGEDPVISSADITGIRLIEEGYIEIKWANRMDYVSLTHEELINANNYIVKLNGTPLELGVLYHANITANSVTTYMTSIQIKNWQNLFGEGKPHDYAKMEEGHFIKTEGPYTISGSDRILTYYLHDGHRTNIGLTLQIAGDLKYYDNDTVANKGTVYDVEYRPFYGMKSYMMMDAGGVNGVEIRTSENNSVANHATFKTVAEHMLKKDREEGASEITNYLRDVMHYSVIMTSRGENGYFLPEMRNQTVFGGSPAGGLSATAHFRATFVNGSGTVSANTIVHEMGHTVQGLALNWLPSKSHIVQAYANMLKNVVEQEMYWEFGTTFEYALSNSGEFFAYGSEMWFNTRSQNNARPTSRQSNAIYNPAMYDVFSMIYYPEDIPGLSSATPSTFSTPFEDKYVANRWENEDDLAKLEDFDFNTQYFRLFSYLNHYNAGYGGWRSNFYGHPGDEAVTWWDISHTPYNYNFDLHSWVVKTKTEDGVTYYQFLNKGLNPANIGQNSGFTSNRYGEDGVSGIFDQYDPINNPEGRGGLALGVNPARSGINDPLVSVVANAGDDYQWWSLVSYEGRYSQVVNKATGLVISTMGGGLPGDGTPLVLAEYKMKPDMGAIWRLIRFKDVPDGGFATTLFDEKYAVIPTVKDVKIKQAWIDSDNFVNIVWAENVNNAIAGNAQNYTLTLNGTPVLFDPSQCASSGNITRLKLLEEPTEQILSGVGLLIQFTGDMTGLVSGMPVNNQAAYRLRFGVGITEGALSVTTDKDKVNKGEYFNVSISFKAPVTSNTAIIATEFDSSKFEYRGFTPAKGVTVLNTSVNGNILYQTVMVEDYATLAYGQVLFSAREDITLNNAGNAISVTVQYVLKDEAGVKTIETAYGATTIYTSVDPFEGREVTLIDLSNIIDILGKNKTAEDWFEKYSPYDFNGNGEIDIYDVSYVAKLILL